MELIRLVLQLDAALVAQFWMYMLVASAVGATMSAFVVRKFHERAAERYQDGIANYDRTQTELKEARAKINSLEKKNQELEQSLRQCQAYLLRTPDASNPASQALLELLSKRNG